MLTRRLGAAFAVLALVALGGCGGDQPREAKPGPLYSPNGEPLSGGSLGDPKCDDAMRRWFGKVDTDHAGTIDAAEFLADARRQFAAMDIEKTGALTPAVLAKYRAPYIADRPRKEARDDSGDDDQQARDRRDRETGPPMEKDRADPVMIADVNLRNRVTLDDFLALARRNFASLDTNKDGRLSLDEVLASCQPE
jgi:hypothetical protein